MVYVVSIQMLLSEEEAKIKAQLWYSENADFLKEQEGKFHMVGLSMHGSRMLCDVILSQEGEASCSESS